MAITPSLIKELRARTGAGMMDCKRALGEAGGDLDAAAAALRKQGIAGAEKKAGRIAAEGVIVSATAGAGAGGASAGSACALVEINCETDFVAKDASFTAYAAAVAQAVLAASPPDLAAAAELKLADGNSIESARRELVARIGENITLRRFAVVTAADGESVSAYLHGARIGVAVKLKLAGDAPGDLGRDIAMHIAASRPLCISEDDVPAQTLADEKAIYTAQAEESGKPANIVEKMVAGRMKKFLKENTLLGQPFVKNPEQSVGQLAAAAGVSVVQMARLEVGEGLEKRADDFVGEVMAQASQTGDKKID